MLPLLAFALLAQAQPAIPDGAPLPPAPAIALDPSASATVTAPQTPLAKGDLPYGTFSLDARGALDAQMRRYFAGEKNEAWFWLGAGAIAAGASTALAFSPNDTAHGASYPLLDISVVQLGAALVLFWRTDDRIARLSEELAHRPCDFFAEEPARMKRVNRGFSIYLPVEATTLVGGAAMAGFGFANKHDFLAGAGLGLVAQSVVMLVFNQFAAARAETYERALREAAHEHSGSCPAQ